MHFNFQKYGQYRNDIFNKININFQKDKKLLDVGCGDGNNDKIFINEFNLDTYGIDIYEDKRIKKIKRLKFKKASIYQIPFPNDFFDYVFLHDVLHHIDEKYQRFANHILAMQELKRVCKKNGHIIIIEPNRYNPAFYPHMVLLKKHNHFRHKYFKKLIKTAFNNVHFFSFECHSYPRWFLIFGKTYEKIAEAAVILKPFLAYNLSIIQNDK